MESPNTNDYFKKPWEVICAFPYAKQLKELGLVMSTFFYYLHFPDSDKQFIYRNKTAFKTKFFNDDRGTHCELIPAPMSEEIKEMIPGPTISWWETNINDNNKDTDSKYWFASSNQHGIILSGKNEASARAKLLISILEKGLLKPN